MAHGSIVPTLLQAADIHRGFSRQNSRGCNLIPPNGLYFAFLQVVQKTRGTAAMPVTRAGSIVARAVDGLTRLCHEAGIDDSHGAGHAAAVLHHADCAVAATGARFNRKMLA